MGRNKKALLIEVLLTFTKFNLNHCNNRFQLNVRCVVYVNVLLPVCEVQVHTMVLFFFKQLRYIIDINDLFFLNKALLCNTDFLFSPSDKPFKQQIAPFTSLRLI